MARWQRHAFLATAPSLLLLLLLLLCDRPELVSSRSPRSLQSTKNNNDDGGSNQTADCDLVRSFFDNKNISVPRGTELASTDTSKTTCGGMCCSQETEERLRHQAREDFHNLIHHHSRSLQGLLATTAEALRDTVTTLARQSENKTLTLFEQLYRGMAQSSKPSVIALYQAMVDYVSPSNTPDTLQQPLTREILQERFADFFAKLFPLAYHGTANQHQEDFTEKSKACLYETIDEIQPFGDIPKQISKLVGKSLEATRILIQALTLGKTVLDRTDTVVFSGTSPQQEACYDALLRMTYCPRCKGIATNIRPCHGFCTNVMRGCLMKSASELDLAWSGYVEKVESLVRAVDVRSDPLGLNVEKAIRQLDTRISNAIMLAMENKHALEEKVRKVCGRTEIRSSTEKTPVSGNAAAVARSPSASLEMHAVVPPPTTVAHRTLPKKLHLQLTNFLSSVDRSRTFYGTLADTICEEYKNKRCWNGERVGEYMKTIVDSSLTAQKYNPEFTVATSSTSTASYGNTNTSVLIDQLRHINQIVQSQLASAPDSGSPLGDEALEGSGSGDKPIWKKKGNNEDIDNDDEDATGDDRDDEEASGSGMGPTTTDPSIRTHQENGSASGSTTILVSSLLLIVVCASSFAA